MLLKIAELFFIIAALWSVAGHVSERTFNGRHSTFDVLPIAYFIQIWIYLFVLNLNRFASVIDLHLVMLGIEFLLIASRWTSYAKSWSTGFQQRRTGLASKGDRQPSILHRLMGRITVSSVITMSALALVVAVVWNLRNTLVSIDDVLTLYKPRIDLLLENQKPLTLDVSVYDSLLNSYPYGPQMLPLRFSMVINSSLALVLDTSLVFVLGLGAIRLLASTFGLTSAMTSIASLLWISSPMVLSQAGTGLTDVTFSCGIIATVAIALSNRESHSSASMVVMILVLVATSSYKLLTAFYLPVLSCCIVVFLAYMRRQSRNGTLILCCLPVLTFPILSLFSINNRIYGSILGDPAIRSNFSESLDFNQKLTFLKINLKEMLVDLLNGNTGSEGDIKSALLGLRNPWGNGTRAIEGVLGPGFLFTMVALSGLVLIILIFLKNGISAMRPSSNHVNALQQDLSMPTMPGRSVLLFLAAGISALWIIYERSYYSIATVRYLLPAISLMAVTSLSFVSNLYRSKSPRSSGLRFSVIALFGLLLGLQIQASLVILNDYKKDGIRGPFELNTGVNALSGASGFTYLPDHVNLLQAVNECLPETEFEEVWSVARDKFPHGSYTRKERRYLIVSPSRVNYKLASSPASSEVLIIGDQLEELVTAPDRVTYRSGYQWLSVHSDKILETQLEDVWEC